MADSFFADHGAFATFSYGYHSVYADDLPVYISADSVLDALHRSYDDILKDLELELLIPTFERYLAGMRARLPDAQGPETAKRHADFLLAMAESLLRGQTVDPAFKGSFDPSELQTFFDAAEAAAGIRNCFQRIFCGVIIIAYRNYLPPPFSKSVFNKVRPSISERDGPRCKARRRRTSLDSHGT